MHKSFSIYLLLFLPIASLFFSSEGLWVFYIMILIIIFLESKKYIRLKNGYLISLLLLPLAWAAIISTYDNFYLIAQSLFYLSPPVLFTILGIQIGRKVQPSDVLKYIVYSGSIGSVIYVIFSVYSFQLQAFTNPSLVREIFLWGSITNVLGLLILLFSTKFGFRVVKKAAYRNLLLGVNFVALYLTASRTYFVVFIISVVIFLWSINKRLAIAILVTFFILLSYFFTYNVDNPIIAQIQAAVDEITFGNLFGYYEIVAQFRGFETQMALQTYFSGTLFNVFFGHGLEKQIDLETYVQLGESYRRIIPIIHNGFVFQLIKQGLIGLIFYLIFFYKIIASQLKGGIFTLYRLVIFSAVASLLASNFVVGTFFSLEMAILWVLFGTNLYHVKQNQHFLKKPGRLKKTIIPI